MSEQEHYRIIGREWTRITWCMYDERIASMWRALRDQLEYPTDPDAPGFSRGHHNMQSAAMRQALIAEIDALGIEPKPEGADHA